MNTEKKVARKVGFLYIIGTVSGILSLVFTEPFLGAEDYLSAIASNPNSVLVGTLFILTMGLSLTFIPPLLHPLFKKHNESLSSAYIVFRSALESITYILSILGMLLLVTLSITFVNTDSPNVAIYNVAGSLIKGADGWINDIRIIVFGISALIINTILYQTKLIPRWISIWGLIAAVLHIANGLMTMFGVYEMLSTVATLMDIPIGLQEMVMALWFIIKGFDDVALENLSKIKH